MGLSYVGGVSTIRVNGPGRGTLLCGAGTGTNGSQSFVSQVGGKEPTRPWRKETHTTVETHLLEKPTLHQSEGPWSDCGSWDLSRPKAAFCQSTEP